MCSYPVAKDTNDITFRDLGFNLCEGKPRAPCGIRQVKALHLSRTVIELHQIILEIPPTIGTRNILRLTNSLAIAPDVFVLQFEVIGLVPFIIGPLILPMTSTTPVLGFAMGPNPDNGKLLPHLGHIFMTGSSGESG